MRGFLRPKLIAGGTRYNFEIEISKSMMSQLIKEFKVEYPTVENGEFLVSVKLFNKDRTKGIEISKGSIMFFPPLDKSESLSMRERIYKNIAKKSEIYLSTSQQDIYGATVSLLANNLRSTASSLYYAIHKYTNSRMYRMFNEDLKLEDFQIQDIQELAHFTSGNFSKAQKYIAPPGNLSVDNYKEHLCHNTNFERVNPFLLFKFLNIEERVEKHFNLYLDLISKTLFNKSFDKTSWDFYKEYTNKFKEKRKNEKTTMEEEIKASISYCFNKIIESKEEDVLVWMLFVLTLRLYWLRQMADYEYDFDVMTSLRELSITLAAVDKFIDIEDDKNLKITENEGETFMQQINEINEKSESQKDTEGELANQPNMQVIKGNSNLNLYNVDLEFPLKNYLEETPKLYMTAIHLEYAFKQEEVFSALNFMSSIKNEGKYFIYINNNFQFSPLNLHISQSGRWTIWVSTDTGILPSDLIGLFELFQEELKNTVKEKDFHLIVSRPITLQNESSNVSLESLEHSSASYSFRRRTFEMSLNKKISQTIGTYEEGALKISNLIINTHVFNLYNPAMSNLYSSFRVNLLNKRNIKDKFINLIIQVVNTDMHSNPRLPLIVEGSLRNKIKKLEQNISFPEYVISPMVIVVSNEILDKFYEGTNQVFLNDLSVEFNNKAYELIDKNEFEISKALLDECFKSNIINTVHYATKGFWYLRNTNLPINESLELGRENYTEAIKYNENSEDVPLKTLEQKFYYELALFNFNRTRDEPKGKKYLYKAFLLGNDEYWDDVIKLSIEKNVTFASDLDKNREIKMQKEKV